MYIESISYDQKTGLFNIEMDDGEGLMVSFESYEKYLLSQGKELEEEDLSYLREENDYLKAESIAIDYLSYRQRSKKEIKDRLMRSHISQDMIYKVIENLEKKGFIDEYSFAKSLANDRILLKFSSKKRIVYDLREKGIDSEIIDQVLNEIPEEKDIENCMKVAKKYSSRKNLKDKKDRQKVYRYLVGKGFSYDLVSSTLERLEEE